MKPTIKDVAKLAGVSFKTVSRVINNEGTVGEKLQKQVWKAVEELNYQPNLSARGLRGGAASIGFVYDNPNSNYIMDMQGGILSECRQQGFELVIRPLDTRNADVLQEVLDMVHRSHVGGLVLTPPLSEDPEILDAIAAHSIPFVRIVSGSMPPDEKSPCVYIDDRTAAHHLTQHLIDLHHRDIAFLGGDEEHKSSGERLQGYRDALEANGLTPDPGHILPGHYSFESGVERTRRLLASDHNRPTAVFACNDEIAAGTLFAARIMGLDVPAQLSIVGFEDSPFSRQAWPNLTTAAQPTGTIAQRATALLIESLRARAKKAQTVESEGFFPQLVVRDSTAEAPSPH